MEEYFGVAEEVGLSAEEVGSVQAIVMAVSAGRVRAQAAEARRRRRKDRSTATKTSD